jgi:multidrug efflux pump subunit AcrA (membrane-fusion protein)
VDETGQKVKRGQPLFNVYSPELVAAQEEYLLAVRAEGQDSRLARSAARRMELWGIGPRYLKRIQEDGKASRTLTITAPRSGYVLHKDIVLGAHVNTGADLYRIGDLDRIWVNTEVYEYDAPWVSVGQPASIAFSSLEGKAWKGTVSYVYPTLNPKSRTLRVRLEFENPGVDLKPGMLAIVRIETRRKDHAVTVPTEAVIHSGERRIVFVVKGYGKYEPREVVTGLVADNNRTEILEGLTKGEEVVVSGQFLLDSESQLQEAVSKLLEARLQAKKKDQYTEDSSAEDEQAAGDTYWTCGMHPEVVQDGPGTCPKCGMDLVEKKR